MQRKRIRSEQVVRFRARLCNLDKNLDVLMKRFIFVMNMLISKSKIFRRQFFSNVCSSYILPSGHSPVMTLSSQNQKTTSQSCFCAVNLQEKTYAEVCSNFIETTLQHGCFPEGLLHIFRALFNRRSSEGLLLQNRFKPGLSRDVNF